MEGSRYKHGMANVFVKTLLIIDLEGLYIDGPMPCGGSIFHDRHVNMIERNA
jgi:hypothetical protein